MPAFTKWKQGSFLENDMAKLFVMTGNWLRRLYALGLLTEDQTVFVSFCLNYTP